MVSFSNSVFNDVIVKLNIKPTKISLEDLCVETVLYNVILYYCIYHYYGF